MEKVVEIIIILAVTLGAVILHELMHGVTAYWLGDRTAKDMGRLSFNPLKHIDPYMSILVPVCLYIIGAPVFGGAKPVPIDTRNLKWREWGMALTAIAGPLTNFLLALIGFLIGHFSGLLYSNDWWGFLFYEIVKVNLGFMVFNLIPIPPLDGSRVLYAIVPDSIRNLMASMEQYGFIVVYLLILVGGSVFQSVMIDGVNGVFRFFLWIVGA